MPQRPPWSSRARSFSLVTALGLMTCTTHDRAPEIVQDGSADMNAHDPARRVVPEDEPPPGPPPPVAEVRPHEIVSPHGTRVDNYYWLRDDEREDPDVLAYLKAENAYRDLIMQPWRGLEERLFTELTARLKQDDASVPYRDRGYYYYLRYEPGKEYSVRARKKGSLDAPEEVLLDGNALAEGHDFFQLGGWEVSPSAALLAWADDTVGRRQYTIRFKNLRTGAVLDDTITNCTSSFVWYGDNKTLLYVEKDPVTLLGVRVKQHVLGAPAAEDRVVYEEPDHSFYLSVGETGDHRFVTISSSSTVSDELRFAPARAPRAGFRVLAARQRDHEYDADHVGGRWIVRTNWQAEDFRVMAVADADAGAGDGAAEAWQASWRELVAHRPGVLVSDIDVFTRYLVLEEQADALVRLRVVPWAGVKDTPATAGAAPGIERVEGAFLIDSDDPAYAAFIDVNAEQDTTRLRYNYSSLTTPETIYELDMATRERRLLKRQPVLGGFDAAHYESERTWAQGRDGTRVPVSLVYRRGFQRDGSAPLYQYAYGAYGSSSEATFRSHVISLLDRGFVYAIAHVRGGQEMGRGWYERGRLLQKRNTFRDFVDVTQHLVREGYAAPDKVVAAGGSAGGLLMGAVVNMRPDLYRVVVADVPFVDVVTTMMDESIPLTTNEFDEWGDPREKAFYDYMLSYSPYDNVAPKRYPAMLVTTGLWDSQVQYFEPAKWVAKLRATKRGHDVLVLHTNMDAGHGGQSGRFRRYRERAMEYAFLMGVMGVSEGSGAPAGRRP